MINVPVTHPIYRSSGSVVPGYLAPENNDILLDGELAPQSILGEDYRVYARKTDSREATIAENEALIESRVRAAQTLTDRQDWSFMMVQFQRTDSIFHTMGHDTEAVRRVYRAVDEAIGSLLELTGEETTIIVVSDHGIHEYERTFRCNTWLQEQGWLQTSTDAERHTWGETTKPTEADGDESTSVSRRLLSTALGTLQRLGVTPRRAEKGLSVAGLSEPVRRILPDDLILNAAEHVDWERSEAYCRSVSSLGLRCNVEGRDPGGVIPQAEFATVRSELVAALENVSAPDGTAVFEDVYDRHDRHGSDIANERSAPDIVVRPSRMVWKVTDVIREPVFDTTDEFSHTYEGLFVAAGPSIDTAADVDLTATDIAPLVLELFGYQPPPNMDGEVPTGLLDRNRASLSPSPETRGRTYFTDGAHGSKDTVTDRLEQLGYLE